ncbi:hypothetical protein PR003_g23446 [Phytophthora rubi]|uniref:Uncharacterized protein n=2 Tax=Phytophthora TaxID=4783 RepID=A0A6A4CZ41_9STRA|nr:hypothetical protein PR003_g23446 [Phytophthora rubi]
MLENSAPAEVTDATGTVGHDSPRKDTDENEKPSGGSTARQASRASIPENNGVVTNDADNVATESRQTDDRTENDYEYDYPDYFPETTEEEAISNAGGGVEPWGDGISNNADADATPVPRADSRGSGKAPRKRKSPRQTAETTATPSQNRRTLSSPGSRVSGKKSKRRADMLADEVNVGIDDDHEVLESDGCSGESADDDSEDEFADELYIAGDTGNESFSVETAEEIRAVAGPQDYITDEMLRGMSDNGWELLPVTDERDDSDLGSENDETF